MDFVCKQSNISRDENILTRNGTLGEFNSIVAPVTEMAELLDHKTKKPPSVHILSMFTYVLNWQDFNAVWQELV